VSFLSFQKYQPVGDESVTSDPGLTTTVVDAEVLPPVPTNSPAAIVIAARTANKYPLIA
jgi:hypothetical protein